MLSEWQACGTHQPAVRRAITEKKEKMATIVNHRLVLCEWASARLQFLLGLKVQRARPALRRLPYCKVLGEDGLGQRATRPVRAMRTSGLMP